MADASDAGAVRAGETKAAASTASATKEDDGMSAEDKGSKDPGR